MEGEYKVTLVVYSGVPDPIWSVHSHHGNFEEMKQLLDDARAKGVAYRHQNMPAILGYKGFLIHERGAEHAELMLGKETTALQKLLLGTMPEGLIKEDLHQRILQAIDSGTVSPNLNVPPSHAPSTGGGKVDVDVIQHYAPKYNPKRWNNQCVQPYNNCYNYANQKITNTFAQPGYASGHPITPPLTAAKTLEACESDGLVKMDVDPSAPVPEAPPQPNCLIALMVQEGVDFHCYRLDGGGFWSQKPGQTAVTDKDGKGNKITDPRKAVPLPYGPQYKFVTFMKIFTNIIDGPE